MSLLVNGHYRIVVRVVGLFVEQLGGTWNHASSVIKVAHHVQQFPLTLAVLEVRGATITEERLILRGNIDSDRGLLLRVGSESPRILVNVLIAGGFVKIPDARITIPERCGYRRAREKNGGHWKNEQHGGVFDPNCRLPRFLLGEINACRIYA